MISLEKNGNPENHIILFENHESNENLRISRENHEHH